MQDVLLGCRSKQHTAGSDASASSCTAAGIQHPASVKHIISQLTQTPQPQKAQDQSNTSDKEAGKPLTEYQLAALKGFSSGATRAEQCSHIYYATFQTSKSYLDHREEIMRQMRELAFALGVEIDEGFFLSKEVVEDIVQIKPNVNGIIATSKTIERGVSNIW